MNKLQSPINIIKWIQENKKLLKPPVSNKQLFISPDFIVMVVAGPNDRHDFHYNETSEFFYQLQGEIIVDLQTANGVESIKINEGEMFLVPPKVEHRPKRPNNSIGLVIEQVRQKNNVDALTWYCKNCNNQLYRDSFKLTSIEKDLLPVIKYFNDNQQLKQCNNCGEIHI